MKKRISVISLIPRSGRFYAGQVRELFGDKAEVMAYSTGDGSVKNVRPSDLYMITTDAFKEAQEAGRYVPADGQVVEIEVTYSKKTVRELKEMPKGTPVLFVNATQQMAREAITQLEQLGVSQLSFMPYGPDSPVPEGFEIAVKTAQPMAIMTSYNLINGVHAANSADLCTTAARKEWGFAGLIMTDWTTTMRGGGSIPWKCVKAGNDLIMPGAWTDRENILKALEDGSLKRQELEECAARVLKMIFCSSGYEDCRSYRERFADLKPYLTVEEEAGDKEPLND